MVIVGFRKDIINDESFTFQLNPPAGRPNIWDLLEPTVDAKYTLSDKMWGWIQSHTAKHQALGHGFSFGLVTPDVAVTNTLTARYYKDGKEILIVQAGTNPRRLTPRECARLQGFPDDFKIVCSNTQAYKQFGNAVVVPLMTDVARLIVEKLDQLSAT